MDGTESIAVETSSPAASAETGASPASEGLTAAPVTEANPAQPSAPEATPAAPIVDQPLEATLEWPSDRELMGMPSQFRTRFGNLKAGYDRLESDHKTLKTQFEPWKEVVNKYGDPAAALNDLQAISGLRNFKFDEQGKIVFDPDTGQPVYDVRPSLEALTKDNPMLAAYIFDELMSFQDPTSGETLARSFLSALGLNPDRLEDYRNYDPSQIATNSDTETDPQIRADVVAKFGEAAGPIFDSMSPALQSEFPYMDEAAQKAMLADQKERLDDREFKEQVRQYQEEQHRQAMANYNATIAAEEDNFLGSLRDSVFDSVLSDIANQVSISANPQVNAMYSQMLRASFASILDPSPASRAAVAPMLKEAGVNLDFAALDRAVDIAKQAGSQYVKLQHLPNQPGYKGAPPDPRAVAHVKATAEGAAQQVGAYLSQVALRLAQSLGGQIKQDAVVMDQRLRLV